MPTYRLGTPEIKAYWEARQSGKSVQEATDAAEKVRKPASAEAAATAPAKTTAAKRPRPSRAARKQ